MTLLEWYRRNEVSSRACGEDLCDVGDELTNKSCHARPMRVNGEVMQSPKTKGEDMIRSDWLAK